MHVRWVSCRTFLGFAGPRGHLHRSWIRSPRGRCSFERGFGGRISSVGKVDRRSVLRFRLNPWDGGSDWGEGMGRPSNWVGWGRGGTPSLERDKHPIAKDRVHRWRPGLDGVLEPSFVEGGMDHPGQGDVSHNWWVRFTPHATIGQPGWPWKKTSITCWVSNPRPKTQRCVKGRRDDGGMEGAPSHPSRRSGRETKRRNQEGRENEDPWTSLTMIDAMTDQKGLPKPSHARTSRQRRRSTSVRSHTKGVRRPLPP